MKVFIASIILSAGLLFQNCSKVQFEELTSQQLAVAAIKTCEEARNKGEIQTQTYEVEFADPGENGPICPFGEDDNAPLHNGYVAARIEQAQVANLPANSVVCGLSLEFADQPFKYDDHIFFTVNDKVMASSAAWAVDLFPKTNFKVGNKTISVPHYNWASIRDQKHLDGSQQELNDFCLGHEEDMSACSWPLTEHEGQIQMQMHEDLVATIGSTAQNNSVKFGFITTGDDNPPTDCMHEPISFSVEVEYAITK